MCVYLQHSADVYFRSIEKLAYYDHKEPKRNDMELSGEFLHPIIEQVKVTQYENEAIIVVKGQRLWFVHSIQLSTSSVVKDPFQVQQASVSFKATMDNIEIPGNQENSEIVVFSHFYLPVQTQLCVQLDVSLELIFGIP